MHSCAASEETAGTSSGATGAIARKGSAITATTPQSARVGVVMSSLSDGLCPSRACRSLCCGCRRGAVRLPPVDSSLITQPLSDKTPLCHGWWWDIKRTLQTTKLTFLLFSPFFCSPPPSRNWLQHFQCGPGSCTGEADPVLLLCKVENPKNIIKVKCF